MFINYFAYGSNMSMARLGQRIPDVQRLGVCHLPQHRLCFHKVSHDGSAKCDARWTGEAEHRVIGVLFSMPVQHKPLLDNIEGVGTGYEVKEVSVYNSEDNEELSAFAYFATQIDQALRPYSWYHHHVMVGAREAGLPDSYVRQLAATETVEDPNRERNSRERAIHRVSLDDIKLTSLTRSTL